MQSAKDVAQRCGLSAADFSSNQHNGSQTQGILDSLLGSDKRFGQHDVFTDDIGAKRLFLQRKELPITGIHQFPPHNWPPTPLLSPTSSTWPFLSRFTRLFTWRST